ncbi:MAG: methyltransferase domain-containing protein [Cyanobacteria bacterium J06554_11]
MDSQNLIRHEMNITESAVQKQYDNLAKNYDWRWRRYLTDTLSFLVDWANVSSTAVVLDVGCGTGELARLLLEQNPHQTIVGIDISELMLVQARQKLRNFEQVTFEQASASALPISDNTFEVVVSANAFHYFPEPEKALAEMRRVLKPGGEIVILDWCKDFLVCQICDLLLQRLDPAHQQCYTEAELHGLLKTAGFRIAQARRIRFGLIWGLMAAIGTKDSDESISLKMH